MRIGLAWLLLALAAAPAGAELGGGAGPKRRLAGLVEPEAAARAIRKARRPLERCFEAGFFVRDATVEVDIEVGVLGRAVEAKLASGPLDVGSCVTDVVRGLTLPRPRPARSAPLRVRLRYHLTDGWRRQRVQGRLATVQVAPPEGVVVGPGDAGIDPLVGLPDELVRLVARDAVSLRGPGVGERDDPEMREWRLVDRDGDTVARLEAPDGRRTRPTLFRASVDDRTIEWSQPRGGRPSERYEEIYVPGTRGEALARTVRARWSGGRWRTTEERIFAGDRIRIIRIGRDGRRHETTEPAFIE